MYIFGPNIFSTAYGEGGGVIRLSVPQGIVIEEGNLVVLPSHDTGVLGSIDKIESVPTEPEQHAYLTFEIPMQSIRVVSVGTSPVVPMTYEKALEYVQSEAKIKFTFDLPPDQSGLSVTATATAPVSTTTNSTIISP